MTALFHRDGDVYIPSDLTRGGWDDVSLHGGPPCGLLARAVEAVPTATPMQVVRFTVDLFRAVPLEPLLVETEVVRDGRRIQLVDATLRNGAVELGRVRALKVRVGQVAVPDDGQEMMPAPPEEAQPLDWQGQFGVTGGVPRFHSDAAEVRTFDDSFSSKGPGVSWIRLLYPVLADEANTPLVTVATLADFGNGNSQVLDLGTHTFVNPDISVHLEREPVGEWIGMRSLSYPHPHGIGLAHSVVYDREGRIGRVMQSQLIEELGS